MTADAARAHMTIGEVLGQLRGEFPDITISKIRFLESEGLIEPARSPSGYRKFARTDIDRLRSILSAQRDEYLPLRVIKDRLNAVDGPPLPIKGGGVRGRPVRGPRTLVAAASTRDDASVEVRLTRRQLLDAAGIEEARLAELEEFGLIGRAAGYYDGDALTVARTARALGDFGFEARHLRVVKAAAEREIGLIDQVVAPLLRQRAPGAHVRAEEIAREIAGLSTRLHTALVSVGLRESLNG